MSSRIAVVLIARGFVSIAVVAPSARGQQGLPPGGTVDLLARDSALEKLATMDEQLAQIVELRFFGGLTIEETAKVLGVSPRTVKYDWRMAKAWLKEDLNPD